MLNFAKGIMYMGTGLAFGSFALFLVTVSNSWTERMTETLILWGGILTGSIVLTAIIIVVYKVTVGKQGGDDDYYDGDVMPRRRQSRSTAITPMGNNGQPAFIIVNPGMANNGRQDGYGYGQQQQALPPPQGSFDYSAARYELEF